MGFHTCCLVMILTKWYAARQVKAIQQYVWLPTIKSFLSIFGSLHQKCRRWLFDHTSSVVSCKMAIDLCRVLKRLSTIRNRHEIWRTNAHVVHSLTSRSQVAFSISAWQIQQTDKQKHYHSRIVIPVNLVPRLWQYRYCLKDKSVERTLKFARVFLKF